MDYVPYGLYTLDEEEVHRFIGKNLFDGQLEFDSISSLTGEQLSQVVTNGDFSESQEFWNHLQSTKIDWTYELETTPTGEKIKGEIKMEKIKVVESFYKALNEELQVAYNEARKALIEVSPSFKTTQLLNDTVVSEINKLYAEEIEAGTRLKVTASETFSVNNLYTEKLREGLNTLQKDLLDKISELNRSQTALYERLALCDKEKGNTVVDVLKAYQIITI